MKSATIAAVVFVVLSGCVLGPVSGWSNVSIEATPRIALVVGDNRAYIRVIIRIEPHPDNRNLVFRWESPDGDIGRKDQQLDGEDSPTIFDTKGEIYFGKHGLQLPAGHYTLTATVERATGDDPSASTKVTVQE